jgi:hypothetical protein
MKDIPHQDVCVRSKAFIIANNSTAQGISYEKKLEINFTNRLGCDFSSGYVGVVIA